MGIYRRGRPRRIRPDSIRNAGESPGEYRIYDEKGDSKYTGETNNLRRRLREHKRTGKLLDGDYIDLLIADKSSTSEERRKHERDSIKKYNPYLNKSIGGEGRIANEIEEYPDVNLLREKRGVGIIVKMLLVVLILAFSIVGVFYIIKSDLSIELLCIPIAIVLCILLSPVAKKVVRHSVNTVSSRKTPVIILFLSLVCLIYIAGFIYCIFIDSNTITSFVETTFGVATVIIGIVTLTVFLFSKGKIVKTVMTIGYIFMLGIVLLVIREEDVIASVKLATPHIVILFLMIVSYAERRKNVNPSF